MQKVLVPASVSKLAKAEVKASKSSVDLTNLKLLVAHKYKDGTKWVMPKASDRDLESTLKALDKAYHISTFDRRNEIRQGDFEAIFLVSNTNKPLVALAVSKDKLSEIFVTSNGSKKGKLSQKVLYSILDLIENGYISFKSITTKVKEEISKPFYFM